MDISRALLPLGLTSLLAAGACGRRSGEAPPIEAPPRPAVVAEDVPTPTDVPVAVDVVPAVDVPAAPTEPPRSAASLANERLLRGLADGSVTLATSVDPARGVVLVSYVEEGPSGHDPERHTNQRLCGAAIARSAALLQRIRETVSRGEGPTCRDDACTVWGMEYQPSLWVHFAAQPDGSRVVVGASELSEAAMNDEWVARAHAYADQALARARATRCPR